MSEENRFSAIAGTIAQAQLGGEGDDDRDQAEQVDFKMVTFSLGGKDYAVDIMKVKEIAKFDGFTYVPNTMHFVRGVYNLRGEIISVIDLRRMFGVPVEDAPEGKQESGLIVRVDDHLLGAIVDSIDRVVGISSSQIQPPHPIFADVNIRYISGVVEHDERLYILLDVERIFARDDARTETAAATPGGAPPAPEADTASAPASRQEAPVAPGPSRADEAESSPAQARPESGASGERGVAFIGEALAAFGVFYPGAVNRAWLSERFEEWKALRGRENREIQLRTEEDAGEFIRPFFSPHTETFWGEDYLEQVAAALPSPEDLPGTLNVWNPGCGKGYESYSFAVLLARTYPEKRVKIWASDSDLLSISTAPNLVFPAASVPEYYKEDLVEGTNGFSFSEAIKESILFEYHDVLHENTVPEVSIILSRDLLSMLPEEAQHRTIADFAEKLRPGGIAIPGAREALDAVSGWRRLGTTVNAYTTA